MCLHTAIQKALAALLSFSITQGVFGSKWTVCREHFILYIPLVSSAQFSSIFSCFFQSFVFRTISLFQSLFENSVYFTYRELHFLTQFQAPTEAKMLQNIYHMHRFPCQNEVYSYSQT